MNDEARQYNLDDPIKHVFISIDPSAGNSSLYVLVSMFYPYKHDKRYSVVLFIYFL